MIFGAVLAGGTGSRMHNENMPKQFLEIGHKPIVIYTVLTSFIAPWVDFIFAKVICRANADQYTVAIGLWKMLEKEYIDNWYTCFAAGAVLVSIPIAFLFLRLQKYYVNGLTGGVKG